MAVHGDRPRVVFRTLGSNLWLAAVALLLGLVAVAAATSAGLPGRIVYVTAAALAFGVVVRALRAGVTATDRGVVVRGFVRTYHLSWDEIAGVSGKVAGDGRCVRIALTDGRTVAARGCSSYSTAKLERIAEAIVEQRPKPSREA